MRCLLRKANGAWTKEEECKNAIRRTAVMQSLLAHVDPRPRMKGFESIDPLACPCCLKKITPELMATEAADFAKLSEPQQAEALRVHSKSHHLTVPFQELVIFMDPKWRGSSHLHRRTNMAHNNVLATFMTVPFDRSKRLRANEALDDAGVLVRFPAKSAKQRMPKLGNGDDGRILHSNPTLLVRLIEIFYEDDPLLNTPGVVALLKELKQAAAGAAALVGPSKRSVPRKRAEAPAATKPKKARKPKKPKQPPKNKPGVLAAEQPQAAPQPQRGSTANAAAVEEAAAAVGGTVERIASGADVGAAVIAEMVKLTEDNMGEFSSPQALNQIKVDLMHRATRIIAVRKKAVPRARKPGELVAFAAYRLNCTLPRTIALV